MSWNRRRRGGLNLWPGFVDAMASLLLVIIFVLLVLVLTQFHLSQALAGKDRTIGDLGKKLAHLAELLDLERAEKADLTARIGRLETQITGLEQEKAALLTSLGELDRAKAALAAAESDKADLVRKLTEEQAQSDAARARAEGMAQQLEALRQELARLAAALDASEKLSLDQKTEIANLGKRLNAALASKVEDLSRYRSEFFGRLRQIIGNRPGVRIEGDRFVFQSELLFASGEATLADPGKQQLAQLAASLKEVIRLLPNDINWVLRIDGHTDKIPIRSPRFASNWELSTARAVTVVQFLAAQGLPADHLAAAGFGEFQPLDPGSAPAALARNRRIEIRLDQR